MRNYSKTIGALAAASTLVAGNALAQGAKGSPVIQQQTATPGQALAGGLEGHVQVGYSNLYEFRFVDVGDDLIDVSINLAYDAGPVTLTGGAWYGSWNEDSFGLGPAGGAPDTELDLFAGVGYSLGPVDLEVGWIYYYFQDQSNNPVAAAAGVQSNTAEIYLSVSGEIAWGINAGTTLFYDYDAASGLYIDTSVSKSFKIQDGLGLNLSGGFGYADGHGLQGQRNTGFAGGTRDGFQGWYVGAELPWEFREGVTLTPYVKYTNADSDLNTNLIGAAPPFADAGQNFFIFGMKLGVTF